MGYLTQEQRDRLLNELKDLKFNQAKGKLRRMDPRARLVFYRNSQTVGRWLTRYELVSLGTQVTLVEGHRDVQKNGRIKSEFELLEVIVEPTPDNRL